MYRRIRIKILLFYHRWINRPSFFFILSYISFERRNGKKKNISQLFEKSVGTIRSFVTQDIVFHYVLRERGRERRAPIFIPITRDTSRPIKLCATFNAHAGHFIFPRWIDPRIKIATDRLDESSKFRKRACIVSSGEFICFPPLFVKLYLALL